MSAARELSELSELSAVAKMSAKSTTSLRQIVERFVERLERSDHGAVNAQVELERF